MIKIVIGFQWWRLCSAKELANEFFHPIFEWGELSGYRNLIIVLRPVSLLFPESQLFLLSPNKQ
jgi:hypothetical protein